MYIFTFFENPIKRNKYPDNMMLFGQRWGNVVNFFGPTFMGKRSTTLAHCLTALWPNDVYRTTTVGPSLDQHCHYCLYGRVIIGPALRKSDKIISLITWPPLYGWKIAEKLYPINQWIQLITWVYLNYNRCPILLDQQYL